MKKFLSILLAIAMLPCMAFAAGAASVSTGYDIAITGTAGDHTATVTVSGTALPGDYAFVTVLDHQNGAKHAQYAAAIGALDFDTAYNVTVGEAFGGALNESDIATYKIHFGHAIAGADGKYSASFAFDPHATDDKVYFLIGEGGSFEATYAATALYIPSEATIAAAEAAISDGVTAQELEAYDYVYGLNTASNAFQTLPEKMAAALNSTTMGTTTAANIKANFNTAEAFYNKQLEALAIINSVTTTADDLYDLLTVTHGDVIGDYGSTLTSAEITAKYTSYDYISVNNLLIGYNYATMADFKSAFVAAAPTTGGDGGNDDGGGGNGPGGGGGMMVPTVPKQEAGATEMFSDLASVPWAKDSITNLAKREVINGMGDGTFNPNGNVTREQFVKMLMLAFGADIKNVRSNFDDVDPTQWYGVYVNTACDYGIVNGVSDTKFGVGNSITRQDLVTMLARACDYFGITLPSGSAVSFADAGSIASYALDAVNTMAGAGIVNGVSDGKFAPGQFATRAQVAVILDRLYTYQQK